MKNNVLYIVIAALALAIILGYFAYKGGKFASNRTQVSQDTIMQEESGQEDDSMLEEEEKGQNDNSFEEEESTPGGTLEGETQAPTL